MESGEDKDFKMMGIWDQYEERLNDLDEIFEGLPRSHRMNKEYLHYKYPKRKTPIKEVLPPVPFVDLTWKINDYDQAKEQLGIWAWGMSINLDADAPTHFERIIVKENVDADDQDNTSNRPHYEVNPDLQILLDWEIDLEKYPENFPEIKIKPDFTMIELQYEDPEDYELVEKKELVTKIVKSIPFINEEGNVDFSKIKIDYKVVDPEEEEEEGEDSDDGEEEDDKPPCLAHILNYIGTMIRKYFILNR